MMLNEMQAEIAAELESLKEALAEKGFPDARVWLSLRTGGYGRPCGLSIYPDSRTYTAVFDEGHADLDAVLDAASRYVGSLTGANDLAPWFDANHEINQPQPEAAP